MTNRILSIATAAAIAISALGTTVPATAATFAPSAPAAASQSAADLLVEVRHGGKHKKGFKRKRGRIHLHFGKKGFHFGYAAYCWQRKKVWTKFGWRWQRVFVC